MGVGPLGLAAAVAPGVPPAGVAAALWAPPVAPWVSRTRPPAWALAPDRLSGFLVVHVAWLALSGPLVFLLVRRIAPGNPALAFLAGAFTTVWAPSDPTRLASVQMIVYSGCTCGALLSAWLLVEAWGRRRPEVGALAGKADV